MQRPDWHSSSYGQLSYVWQTPPEVTRWPQVPHAGCWGSFPGLAQWRTFHETGFLPPELAALAERGRLTE